MTTKPARHHVAAGGFYPARSDVLSELVDRMLADARVRIGPDPATGVLRAVVAPHAGYPYSGPIAAAAYARLGTVGARRVAVIGPAHFVPLGGVAVPLATRFTTPLGDVEVDVDGCRSLVQRLESVHADDRPHRPEHSVEVQLPFLQRTFGSDWVCLPMLAGSLDDDAVAEVLDAAAPDRDTLLVVSTDLSHYLPHADAVRHDRRTADAVLSLDAAAIGPRDACGFVPLRGLLRWARRHQLTAELLDLRTSGDTAGSVDRVVGYGAFAFVASARA